MSGNVRRIRRKKVETLAEPRPSSVIVHKIGVGQFYAFANDKGEIVQMVGGHCDGLDFERARERAHPGAKFEEVQLPLCYCYVSFDSLGRWKLWDRPTLREQPSTGERWPVTVC